MRTKPVAIVIGLIAAAIAVAWLVRERPAPGPELEIGPVAEQDATPDAAKPVIDAIDAPTFTPSPQGLYDDLDAAFERAGKKPDIELQRPRTPELAPPERADDDGDEP